MDKIKTAFAAAGTYIAAAWRWLADKTKTYPNTALTILLALLVLALWL
jgi:hypothetical protein